MPKHTYEVTTSDGVYEIDVDEAAPTSVALQGRQSAATSGMSEEAYNNSNDSLTGQVNQSMQSLAYPETVSDVGHLMMVPTDITRSVGTFVPNAIKQVGDVATRAGNAIANTRVGKLISRTHLDPSAISDFEVNKPLKVLGKLFKVDPESTPNPLANMGRGPSTPSAGMPGPVVQSQAPSVKPSYSAQDVVKIRQLMDRGVPEAAATAMVKSQSLGQFIAP